MLRDDSDSAPGRGRRETGPQRFFVLGQPKCGTTTLYDVLGAHPAVTMSIAKEPRFFELHFDRGVDWYESECFPALGEATTHVGEATPMYLSLPWVPERIATSYPHALAIVALRDPWLRAESEWWMHWSAGREPLGFEAALRQNLERLERDPDLLEREDAEQVWKRNVRRTEVEDDIQLRMYIDFGLSASGLARYRELLGREALYLFDFSAMATGDDAFEGVARFLGLPPGPRLEPRHSKPGISPRWAPLIRAATPLRRAGLVPRAAIEFAKRAFAGRRQRYTVRDRGLALAIHERFAADWDTVRGWYPELPELGAPLLDGAT